MTVEIQSFVIKGSFNILGLFFSFRLHGVLDKLRSVTTGKVYKNHVWVFLGAQILFTVISKLLFPGLSLVKKLLAMQETWV